MYSSKSCPANGINEFFRIETSLSFSFFIFFFLSLGHGIEKYVEKSLRFLDHPNRNPPDIASFFAAGASVKIPTTHPHTDPKKSAKTFFLNG